MVAVLPQLIILFVTDQFRRDAFQPEITPNLHKLSLHPNTTTFTNAYVSTPTCTPARASLLTGKSPWNHGMLGYAESVNCQEYPTTLPAMISKLAGYETYSAGKNHFGWDNHGNCITHGFQHLATYEAKEFQPEDDYDKYFHKLHPGEDPINVTCNGLGYNDWKACPYGNPDESQHPTAWTTRQALKFLTEFDFSHDNQRMFLKISYHRPHSPYDPPLRLFQKRLNSKVPSRFINNTSWDSRYQNKTSMSHNDWHGDPGESAARHTRAGYLANVEFVDEGVGTILNWIEKKSLLDNSMVLWTSDHGDMNGDHNLWRKGYPYEASAHVNLVVKLPRRWQGSMSAQPVRRREMREIQKRTTSDAIVETRDIAVTIYDVVGIVDVVQRKDPMINGKSLLPILVGEAKSVRQWLDLEHAIVYDDAIHWNAIVGLYWDKDTDDVVDRGGELWKYIFHAYDGREQLFCLTKDPNETYDISHVEPRVLEHFQKIMIEQFEKEERGEDWVRNGQLVVHRTSLVKGPNFPCRSEISSQHRLQLNI